MTTIAYNTSDLHCEIYDPSIHIESDGWLILEVDYDLPPRPWTYKNGFVKTWIPVMDSLPMAEFRKRIVDRGIMPGLVDAAIASISDEVERTKAQIDWEYQPEVRRTSPLVIALAPAFGLSEEQVDAVFQ